MSDYIKHTWQNGEPISADKLNNMETGIAEANKNAENAAVSAKKVEDIAEKANEHDLVISLDIPGLYLTSDAVIPDNFSIESGSVQDTYTKLKSGKEVKVILKCQFCYGLAHYIGIYYPVFVVAETEIDYAGVTTETAIGLEFCTNYVPGYRATTERIYMKLLTDGTVFNASLKDS